MQAVLIPHIKEVEGFVCDDVGNVVTLVQDAMSKFVAKKVGTQVADSAANNLREGAHRFIHFAHAKYRHILLIKTLAKLLTLDEHVYFVRNVDEGGFKINQKYTFKQNYKKVNNGKKDFKVPLGIQDMISSFYKARTLDFSDLKKGKVFSFKCFMDDEVYDLKIKYKGTETIKIRKGKFKCYKFVPVVQTGRYFENEEDVQFWVTADENRIPVLVKAKIPVGTVKMHLIEWNGLKNELSSKM